MYGRKGTEESCFICFLLAGIGRTAFGENCFGEISRQDFARSFKVTFMRSYVGTMLGDEVQLASQQSEGNSILHE